MAISTTTLEGLLHGREKYLASGRLRCYPYVQPALHSQADHPVSTSRGACHSLPQAGRDFVRQWHDWSVAAQALEGVYLRLKPHRTANEALALEALLGRSAK